MEFLERLHPLLSKWFRGKFAEPTEVQVKSIPLILEGENVLITSPTGSGKTLAAFLGILSELLSGKKGQGITCVYISPLRALNRDIERNLVGPLEEVLRSAKEAGVQLPAINVGIRTSDTSNYEKARMLKYPPDILITTPESFAIALSTEKFSKHLTNVRYVVVDEIHEVCSGKRGVELSVSLERLERLTGTTPVRIGVSATLAPIEDIAGFLGGYLDGRPRPVEIVSVGLKKGSEIDVIPPVPDYLASNVEGIWNKTVETVLGIIKENRTTLVFTNTRRSTERMVMALKKELPDGVQAHHGSLSKETRLEVESSLRSGKLKAVVCSTSLELGIDIGAIDMVVQIGSPKSIYRLIQRIGRAGHSLHGLCKARLIPQSAPDMLECMALVRAVKGGRLDRIEIPTNCLDMLSQSILALSLQAPVKDTEALDLFRHTYCFRELTKKDFDLALSFLSGKKGAPPGTLSKVHHDPKSGIIMPRRGMRFLYFLNSGTIPPEMSYRVVDEGGEFIGTLSQDFGQLLRVWDVFLLGGTVFQALSFNGQSINVRRTPQLKPTIPVWYSEVPSRTKELSFEMRGLLSAVDASDPEMSQRLSELCGVSMPASTALARYLKAQFDIAGGLPGEGRVFIEGIIDPEGRKALVYHTFMNRRLNSTLALLASQRIKKEMGLEVQASVTDDSFLLSFGQVIPFKELISGIAPGKVRELIIGDIRGVEMFRQHFRLNAQRSLMILKRRRSGIPRNHYKLSMRILDGMSEKEMKENLVAKETIREVLDMGYDVPATSQLIRDLVSKQVKTLVRNYSKDPTPFSLDQLSRGLFDAWIEAPKTGWSAVLEAGLEPAFLREELQDYFHGGQKPMAFEAALAAFGPQSFEELLESTRTAEDKLTEQLYRALDHGDVVTGFFKPSKQRVQYMRKKDWGALKLRHADLTGALLDRRSLVPSLMERPISLETHPFIISTDPFVSRGKLRDIEENLLSRSAFKVRVGSSEGLVARKYLDLVTSALRRAKLDEPSKAILELFGDVPERMEDLEERAGLTKAKLQEVLSQLYENIYIVKTLSRGPGSEVWEGYVKNPASASIPRENALRDMSQKMIEGYGVISSQYLGRMMSEPNMKTVLDELCNSSAVSKGYVVEKEISEVYFKGEFKASDTGVRSVPGTDPALVLMENRSDTAWYIFENDRMLGSFSPRFEADQVFIEELNLGTEFFFDMDLQRKSQFIGELFSNFKELMKNLDGPTVCSVPTINSYPASAKLKEYGIIPPGFRDLSGALVLGSVWDDARNFGDVLELILARQRVTERVLHPMQWVEANGYVATTNELLLRMQGRYYNFNPNLPGSRRIALHSLEELAKMNELFETYDMASRPVFATRRYLELLRAAKGREPTRLQSKILDLIPDHSFIDPKKLKERADISESMFKRALKGLMTSCLVARNGYGILVKAGSVRINIEEARAELVRMVFDQYLMFDLKNLHQYFGEALSERTLAAILERLEEEGELEKGFLTGSRELSWLRKDVASRLGDMHSDQRFILTPRDPLSEYLRPRIKERFGRAGLYVVFKGARMLGAFKGRLSKNNFVISDVIDVAPQEIRDDVEKFSELCGLRSFKSEEAFKKYKHAKKIRKAMYEEYGYSEEEMDDYFEEYDRYFGDMTEEEEFAEAPAEAEVAKDEGGVEATKEEAGGGKEAGGDVEPEG